MKKMKKIFNSLFLLIVYPIKLLRRSKFDNFVGGLMFGALFSLFVNVITIQLQEVIQRQRILEAVEQEIVGNLLQANNYITFVNDEIEGKKSPNIYYSIPTYEDRVWNNAEALKYVVQLEPTIQTKLILYYRITVAWQNRAIIKHNEIISQELADCFLNVPESNIENCQLTYYSLLNAEVDSADSMFNDSKALLDLFHPTQDRLKNPLLRFFLGKNSMRILQGDAPNTN